MRTFLFSPWMPLQLGWGRAFLTGLWGHLLFAKTKWQWSGTEGTPNFLNICDMCSFPLTSAKLVLLLGSCWFNYIIVRTQLLLLSCFRYGPLLHPERKSGFCLIMPQKLAWNLVKQYSCKVLSWLSNPQQVASLISGWPELAIPSRNDMYRNKIK